jgi:DNA-binding NarL/FixJ family response regulator
MSQYVAALVVAKPSPLRDSLVALLRSLPMVATVQQADTAAGGLRIFETNPPGILLLDAGLPGGDAWRLLRTIRTKWPTVRCVVLADNGRLRRRAEDAGADRALLKGYPAARLSVLLEQTLQHVA